MASNFEQQVKIAQGEDAKGKRINDTWDTCIAQLVPTAEYLIQKSA